MAKKGKVNVWEDAINKRNEEATKVREASDFLNEKAPKNENDDAVLVSLENNLSENTKTKPIVVKEQTIKYTSKKPFKNTSGRESVNTHNEVIEQGIYGDVSQKKKWTIIGLIFSSLLMALILVPLIIVIATGALVVDNFLTMREQLGYKVNITEFSIKHEESGKYLQNPTYEGEQLLLGDEKVETFKFTNDIHFDNHLTKGVFNYDDLWISSEMIFNGNEMVVSFDDGMPVWTGVNANSTIHLNKKSEDENKFSISLNNKEAFIAKDDSTNKIVLSKKPDWFSFETNVHFTKTKYEYFLEYVFMNKGLEGFDDELTLGAEGNPITISSFETGLSINSYQELKHSELPYFTIEEDEYKDALRLSHNTDTNLFIQTNEKGEMALSAYQTLPLDRFATDEWQKYYPIIVANDDDTLSLELHDLSQYNEMSLAETDIANAQFWLLPNPNNLRERAIYFPAIDGFLTTRGGKLGIQHIEDVTEIDELLKLEYFNIYHSPNKNPEITKVKAAATLGGVRKNIVALIDNFDVIDGFEFYGYGYETRAELEKNPSEFKTEVREKSDCTRRKNVIKLRDLEENTFYHGVIATYRKDESGVGKHVTFTYVPWFETGDKGFEWPDTGINWPNINWPDIDWPEIGWPTLPIIDPGDPITDGGNGDAAVAKIWDSTDEVNSMSNGDDIPKDEMLTAASTKIEVSVKLTQGTQDGRTKDLGVRLQEVDASGNVVDGGYDSIQNIGRRPTDGGEYLFVFDGLTPETDYIASVVFYDGGEAFVQSQTSPLELDHGDMQMKATTERVAPSIVSKETNYHWDSDGSGFSVYMVGNDIRDTDQIKVQLKNKTTGEIETTNWVYASEWDTYSLDEWTFSKNTRPNGTYYEATCSSAIALDAYDVDMWIKMDTSNDFIGWDHDSPAFDNGYDASSDAESDDSFDIINVLSVNDVVATRIYKDVRLFNMNDVIAEIKHIIK